MGTVIASRHADVPEGTSVLHGRGWREHAVLDGDTVQAVDTSQFSDGTYLGVLGMTGLTAYTGLVHVAEMQEGDAVFISGAAGPSARSPARSPACWAPRAWSARRARPRRWRG